MNAQSIKDAVCMIAEIMSENKDYLIQLDSQNGDGDLGVSMENGFRGARDFLMQSDLTDTGKLLNKTADHFNEAAPSSLGTILSFGFKGMARSLKGKETFSVLELAEAFEAAVSNITAKAGSKPGEKTILDAICPAAKALAEHSDEGISTALEYAAEAAREGSESTKEMRAVWGRAAYYGENSIGILDGGSVVGKLIFEALLKLV